MRKTIRVTKVCPRCGKRLTYDEGMGIKGWGHMYSLKAFLTRDCCDYYERVTDKSVNSD